MSMVEKGGLVHMADIEGRGRALVASQPLRAGQIILRDSPLLLYSALPLHQHQQKNYIYCSNCFRVLTPSNSSVVSCPSSCSAFFCSTKCQSLALISSHTAWVCQSLTRLRDSSSLLQHPQHQDIQVQARFLVAAYNLAVVSPSGFQTLLSLQGDCHGDDGALFLHSMISTLCPPPLPSQNGFSFSFELTAALLAKDKLNAFGLMEPFSEESERSVRAYGIYPKASFFNHDCLPNACRFDYLDAAASEHNAEITVRAIHDVAQGREICLSYFPVNLKYSDRQRRLKEDYGFACDCDRCKVEANWSDDDEEEGDEAMSEEDETMIDEGIEEDGGVVEEENDFPHAYFFLKYMCNRNCCWGTLAPLPPSDAPPSTVMECNVCGNLKNSEALDG